MQANSEEEAFINNKGLKSAVVHDDGNMSKSFEKIEGISKSQELRDNSREIRPLTNLELNLAQPKREETMIEKLKNIGTNLKYEITSLSQSFMWRPTETEKAYLLGREYDFTPNDDDIDREKENFKRDFSKIIWFTYRKNFPKLLNHKKQKDTFINDTGWGCMIRACQMAFAQCLRTSLEMKIGSAKNKGMLEYKLINWFLDSELDPKKAPYSIQNLITVMYEKFELKPGTWFKASHVLLALQKIHNEFLLNIPNDFKDAKGFDLELEIFLEGTLYIHQILNKMTMKLNPIEEVKYEADFELVEDEESKSDSNLLKTLGLDDLFEKDETALKKEITTLLERKWKGKLMITMLAKIGLDKPNPEYFDFIKELLSLPQSIGMIGGKPGLAYYIVGYLKDALLYLDPHFVQESVPRDNLKEKLGTYFCDNIRYLNFSEIDTSVGLCFLIKDDQDFRNFIQSFKIFARKNNSFLGLEVAMPCENFNDVESVDSDGDFQKCQPHNQDVEQF